MWLTLRGREEGMVEGGRKGGMKGRRKFLHFHPLLWKCLRVAVQSTA